MRLPLSAANAKTGHAGLARARARHAAMYAAMLVHSTDPRALFTRPTLAVTIPRARAGRVAPRRHARLAREASARAAVEKGGPFRLSTGHARPPVVTITKMYLHVPTCTPCTPACLPAAARAAARRPVHVITSAMLSRHAVMYAVRLSCHVRRVRRRCSKIDGRSTMKNGHSPSPRRHK